jgi:hypothetical protein
MFISHELFTRLKADLDKDLVELTDGGKTILINGKSLAIHLWGEVAERFHLLTKEAKDELYAKIKAEALKISNEAKAKIDAIDAILKADEVKIAAGVDKGIAVVASYIEKEVASVAADATADVNKAVTATETVTAQAGAAVDQIVVQAAATVKAATTVAPVAVPVPDPAPAAVADRMWIQANSPLGRRILRPCERVDACEILATVVLGRRVHDGDVADLDRRNCMVERSTRSCNLGSQPVGGLSTMCGHTRLGTWRNGGPHQQSCPLSFS